MLIKRETDYAVRAVLHIARAENGIATVNEVAEAQSIPRDFTAKILQRLTRAGILESIRGVKGGYKLKRPPTQVSLFDVLEAMEGPTSLNLCVLSGDLCDRTPDCPVHPFWVEISEELAGRLKEVTFEKILQYERDTKGP